MNIKREAYCCGAIVSLFVGIADMSESTKHCCDQTVSAPRITFPTGGKADVSTMTGIMYPLVAEHLQQMSCWKDLLPALKAN
jgi:hypothetical protein